MKDPVPGDLVAPIKKKIVEDMDVFDDLGVYSGTISEKSPGFVIYIHGKFVFIRLSNGRHGRVERWSIFVINGNG